MGLRQNSRGKHKQNASFTKREIPNGKAIHKHTNINCSSIFISFQPVFECHSHENEVSL